MTLFYGVELDSVCSRPPDIDAIMSMDGEVQDWVLGQLARWVREHGGDRSVLLRDAPSQWVHHVLVQGWNGDEYV